MIYAGASIMRKEKKMDGPLYTRFDSVFFEKTRLSIITVIYKEGLVSFNRLKNITRGTDGSVYNHLQKLQDTGYIARKKEINGNRAETFYSLTKRGKKEFGDYLVFLESIISNDKKGTA